ncbi:hypothetical protein ACIRQP_03550 [Streptomyces sp. NPDC102274]|uniref:hypothetical protein n=1 Tax=Streptomyces sp. NPDC102274 TaxID=3366151 RepID=UPI003805EF53
MPTEMPNQDRLADLIRETLDAYFAEVDHAEAETDDMAWSIVRRIEREVAS